MNTIQKLIKSPLTKPEMVNTLYNYASKMEIASTASSIFQTKPNYPTPLGRWKLKTHPADEDIASSLANYDSCGDSLCGNPNNIREFIDQKIVEKRTQQVSKKESLEKELEHLSNNQSLPW